MVAARQVLAIIPARGGSKSIPRKNIKLLGGVPLLAYSIAAGLQARTVQRVIVSTDDEEIAAVARTWGAEVPFLRPAALAQDDTLDLPVFEHALAWLNEHERYSPDAIVHLRPTSPFRPPDCVDRGIEILLRNDHADSVRAVVPSGQNPYKMWSIGNDTYLHPLLTVENIAEPYNTPRQHLPATYWQTGHLDIMRRETVLMKHSMTGDCICPLLLDPGYTIDIDTFRDWERAEWMLTHSPLPFALPRQRAASALPSLEMLRLLVLDFDGVLTDNRVLVNEHGEEAVLADRSDGWGIAQLKKAGLEILVLSTETNPVVAARCRKLKLDYVQGQQDKLTILKVLAQERNVTPDQIAYVGNDVNDQACMEWVGTPIAVADAVPEVRAIARWLTSRPGGHGAVRELADALLKNTL